MKQVVTFGEIMLRLSPPGHQRIVQTSTFDAVFGGGEANVAVSLSHLGVPASFVTRLPENDLGRAVVASLRSRGVDTASIQFGGNRLGVYYLEKGVAQRPGKVIYDRAGSSIAEIQPGMVDWEDIFKNADWFHWTGITPALSRSAADTCLEALKVAKNLGLTISGDPNYRANLWQYDVDPQAVIREMLTYCDIIVANEFDAPRLIGSEEKELSVEELDSRSFKAFYELMRKQFPNIKTLATTRRKSISASQNQLSGLLCSSDSVHSSQVYDIHPIVDRVGGGDAFMGGLIYGLLNLPDREAINFATAASVLKHTIPGDVNLVSVDEIKTLMSGTEPGALKR